MGMHMSGSKGYWIGAWFAKRKEGGGKGVEVWEEAGLAVEGCDRKSVATIERIARGGASKG